MPTGQIGGVATYSERQSVRSVRILSGTRGDFNLTH